MTPRKIYKITHDYQAADNNAPAANLPVPLRSGPYSASGQHIHARNSSAFITQLLNTNKQNSMRHGRFERTANRARHAYGHAANLPRSATHTYREKHLFI